MTLTAFSLRWDVINFLRRCNTRIMAGRTIAAYYKRIMDKSVDECSKADVNGVARRTVQVRCYMSKRLAFADITVMAGQAVAGICARVVKRRTSKGRGVVMANVAFLVIGSGRYMIREFTDTGSIVVARRAVACNHADMIKGARAKSPQGMAVATILITGRTRIVRISWHVRIESCGKWFACGSNLW